MSNAASLTVAQNEALYGSRYFGQEGFFDFEWLETILPPIAPGGRILDIGGGNGVLSCRIATTRGAIVTCLEADQNRARVARQNVFLSEMDEMVTVMRADMDRLDASFFDKFEIVLALDSLQHSRDLLALLGRILGCERPPHIVATIWCCDDDELARRWGFLRGYRSSDVERYVRSFSQRAKLIECPVFRARFVRYRDFLDREASRMSSVIGPQVAEDRASLVDATLAAIEAGRFSQMVVSV